MRTLLAFAAPLAIAAGLAAQTATTVHPSEYAKLEGNYSGYYYYYGAWWYSTSSATSRPFRMQYVMDMPSTVKGALDAVTFRRDSSNNPGLMSPSYWTEIEVTCSTSPVKAASISTTFASNAGNDATIVIAKKKISVAPKPYIGSIPEPFLVTFAFDKKFVYLATKGSLCFDVKHYDNSLYNSTTKTYSYMYIDSYGYYTSSTSSQYGASLEGPSSRCFNSNPWIRNPMRHYSYSYVNSSKQLNMYWYGYDLEQSSPFIIAVGTSRLPAGIPLGCGNFELNPAFILFSIAGISNNTGYGRYPASGNLVLPFDSKTMGGLPLFSQIVSISKTAKLSVTNWYLRTTPIIPTGTPMFGNICYRNGTTAFTSTTGYTYTSFMRGPVWQLRGIQ